MNFIRHYKKGLFQAFGLVTLLSPVPALVALEDDLFSQPLISQHGERVTLEAFSGKLVVLNFIFTHCPSACPMQTSNVRKVQKGLSEAQQRDIQFLSLSIDPARDTPARMLDYAKRFRAELASWQFITGDAGALQKIADAFDAAAVEIEAGDDLEHKLRIFVLSPSRNLLQVYGGSNFNTQRVLDDLAGFHQAYFPATNSLPNTKK